jgi:hypothetical protein
MEARDNSLLLRSRKITIAQAILQAKRNIRLWDDDQLLNWEHGIYKKSTN